MYDLDKMTTNSMACKGGPGPTIPVSMPPRVVKCSPPLGPPRAPASHSNPCYKVSLFYAIFYAIFYANFYAIFYALFYAIFHAISMLFSMLSRWSILHFYAISMQFSWWFFFSFFYLFFYFYALFQRVSWYPTPFHLTLISRYFLCYFQSVFYAIFYVIFNAISTLFSTSLLPNFYAISTLFFSYFLFLRYFPACELVPPFSYTTSVW